MFGLIRGAISIVSLAVFIWFGATVRLGKRTLFGHVKAIWVSDQGRDLRKGVGEKATEVRKEVGDLMREQKKADGGLHIEMGAPNLEAGDQ